MGRPRQKQIGIRSIDRPDIILSAYHHINVVSLVHDLCALHVLCPRAWQQIWRLAGPVHKTYSKKVAGLSSLHLVLQTFCQSLNMLRNMSMHALVIGALSTVSMLHVMLVL